MSSLSWLIFLVGMCDKINGLLEGFLIFALLVFIILTVVRVVFVIDDTFKNEKLMYATYIANLWKIDVIATSILVILQVVIPTKQTAVLIAAAEVGQQVMQSRQVEAVGDKFGGILGSSADLLQTWISKETQSIQDSLKK